MYTGDNMTSLPYPIYGTITASDNSTPSTRVTLRNDRSGGLVNVTSNASGQYITDASNFTNGYLDTDRVTLIVGYGDEEGTESILISSGTHNVDITLSTISESTDVTYCQIQDVLDELGDKTIDDISYERLRKIILRNESEIEERAETKFKTTTVTDEYHDFNQYSSYKSPDQLRGWSGALVTSSRNDSMQTNFNDRFFLNKSPILSITSLYKNTASVSSTDSWTELTEQTGSGGDFIVDYDTGMVTFVDNFPSIGSRRVKASYTYGYSSVPKIIERLCVLLSVRDVITSKRSEAQFDGSSSINLGGEISISKFDSPTYLNWLNEEIERLWKIVGDMRSKTA